MQHRRSEPGERTKKLAADDWLQFAYWLADRHNRLHVDEMLDELSPEEIVGWRAAKVVVPLDDGWRQAGTIAAGHHNDMERVMAAKAGHRYVQPSRLRSPEDYIPKHQFAKAAGPLVNWASIDAHQAAMESRYVHTR